MQKCDCCGTTQGALVTMCGMCRLGREPVETNMDWKDELIGELENACKMVINDILNRSTCYVKMTTLKQVQTVRNKVNEFQKQGKLSIRIGEHPLPADQPEQDGHKSALLSEP